MNIHVCMPYRKKCPWVAESSTQRLSQDSGSPCAPGGACGAAAGSAGVLGNKRAGGRNTRHGAGVPASSAGAAMGRAAPAPSYGPARARGHLR